MASHRKSDPSGVGTALEKSQSSQDSPDETQLCVGGRKRCLLAQCHVGESMDELTRGWDFRSLELSGPGVCGWRGWADRGAVGGGFELSAVGGTAGRLVQMVLHSLDVWSLVAREGFQASSNSTNVVC